MSDNNKLPPGAPGTPGTKTPAAPAGLITNGMVVYFDEVKRAPHRKALKLKFRGHGFGIMLGVVPEFKKEPTRDQVVALLASVGFVLLDDVADFLGDEVAATFTEKFYVKYETTKPEESAIVEPEPSKLVGLNGQPLESPPVENEPIPLAARREKPDAPVQ